MMKHQQVSVDFVKMVFTGVTYLALAGAAWNLLRLLQACFWLPNHLKKQTNIQRMLQDKVDSYEKYINECETNEKAAAERGILEDNFEELDNEIKPVPIDEEKWRERRECLAMLKKELKRVSDGGDVYNWDHLLEDDENNEEETSDVAEDGKNGDVKHESDDAESDKLDSDVEKIDDVPEKNNELKKDK